MNQEYIASSFVKKCYQFLLDRLPDTEGEKHFLSYIERGGTRENVILGILASDEYQHKQKNWREIHLLISQLLAGRFEDTNSYLALLSQIELGNRLRPKFSELAKLQKGNFYAIDDALIYIDPTSGDFGVLVEIFGLNSTGKLSQELFSSSYSFSIGGVSLETATFSRGLFIKVELSNNLPLVISSKNGRSVSIVLKKNTSNPNRKFGRVAVVGRFESSTGIGEHSLAFLSQLSQRHECFIIDTRPNDSCHGDIPSCVEYKEVGVQNAPQLDVAIYTDVFSNSISDENYKKVPDSLLKFAYVVFDSSRLPRWWVEKLNTNFDAVLTPSKWGKKMIENSGVMIPVFYLPLALNYELYDSKRVPLTGSKRFRFGAIASYSDRKNILQLVRCFIECFGNMQDKVELVIHSPLIYGGVYEKVIAEIESKGVKNVIISSDSLDRHGYVILLNTFNVLVSASKGECYSIPPRQAMALGKPVLLTRGHAHDEIIDAGVGLGIQVKGFEPAFLEAFDGQHIGLQCTYDDTDICDALRNAYYNYLEIAQGSAKRQEFAKSFSHEALKFEYDNLISAKAVFFGKENELTNYGLETSSPALFQKYRRLKARYSLRVPGWGRKIVVPVHDGGFFSVFNTFLSHFVWNFGLPDVAAVIPDWRVSTLREYRKISNPMSFCYGNENDGNIFTKVFLPIPSMPLSEDDYNNDEFLKSEAFYLDDFNEKNEPLLTYIHARELYKSSWFHEWRIKYGRYYKQFFVLREDIETEIEYFFNHHFKGGYVIGVHVKHPSHAIEQPNGFMPGVSDFIKKILDVVEAKGLLKFSIFLATDQELVVEKFRSVFGDRVICREGISRTTIDDDQKYSQLDINNKLQEGHQIQNIVASDPTRWSINMAKDVVIDASLLARTNCFIHVTSNVATAVSYINPDLEMIYCE